MTALPGIWILVLTLRAVTSQSFSNQELLRLHQLTASSAHSDGADTVTGYRVTEVSTDDQPLSSALYPQDDQSNTATSRSDTRRKIFHIKNPFQSTDDNQNFDIDSDSGASNQFAAMQYTLPSEEFLKQMRAEGHLPQYSTPAPAQYQTTPQPQFYQAPPVQTYERQNQVSQYSSGLSPSPDQNSVYNYFGSSFASEGPSTPSPQLQYVSTPAPASQFVGTPNSPTYVSSQSPTYLTSQPSVQYLTSQSSPITTSVDYSNRLNAPSSSAFDGANANVNMQIDHFNHAINGVRFPFNGQAQPYQQNEVSTTTISPASSSIFPEQRVHDWRNSASEQLPKSIQDVSHLTQYQPSLSGSSQHESLSGSDSVSYNVGSNSDTHRVGNSIQSANNLYLNFLQPEYQQYQIRTRTRDLEQETGQPEVYSHGDYGWKMNSKRPLVGSDTTSSGSYSNLRPQALPLQSAQPTDLYSKFTASQTSFQTDAQKQNNLGYNIAYNAPKSREDEYISKTTADAVDTQEFVKAAAKVHESMKMQHSQQPEPYYGHSTSPSVVSYAPTYQPSYLSNPQPSNVVSTYYGNSDKFQKETKYYTDSTTQSLYGYGYPPNDLVTALPYLYSNLRNQNVDTKSKEPFDHAKALKNIVPIDVSNVIYQSENNGKTISFANNPRQTPSGSQKDQIDPSLKQLLDQYKPLNDVYYRDKGTTYSFNYKPKPDNYVSPSEGLKQSEILQFHSGKQGNGLSFNQDYYEKRYGDNRGPVNSYQQPISPSYPQQLQESASMQHNTYRPHDLANMLKLNDIPYKLSQNSLSLGLGAVSSYDPNLPPLIPNRINQNVGSHQLEPTNTLLSKLSLFSPHKQYGNGYARPNEQEPQSSPMMSTINGMRVANPYNVDLKLVSEMLKGKPTVDETRMIPIRDHYNRLAPMKMDISSIQQILAKGENGQSVPDLVGDPRSKDFNAYESLAALSAKFREMENEGMGPYANQYIDVLNYPRYPFQNQVKYSRSQEEEETVPAAEGTNTHPIGAVIEEDEPEGDDSKDDDSPNSNNEEVPQNGLKEHRPKLKPQYEMRERRPSSRHPNSLYLSRPHYRKRHPTEGQVAEPYPLLKPPRPPKSRVAHYKREKRNRLRNRLPRLKTNRMLKTEPLFDADKAEDDKTPVSVVLKPPPPAAESKSDDATKEE